MNYFYDKQIRQHLVQFIRMFSNFSVQIGESENGDPIYRTVPAKYGDPTRMAAAIMRENSENKMLSVPQITVYITNINMAPDRRHHVGMESKQTIYRINNNSFYKCWKCWTGFINDSVCIKFIMFNFLTTLWTSAICYLMLLSTIITHIKAAVIVSTSKYFIGIYFVKTNITITNGLN